MVLLLGRRLVVPVASVGLLTVILVTGPQKFDQALHHLALRRPRGFRGVAHCPSLFRLAVDRIIDMCSGKAPDTSAYGRGLRLRLRGVEEEGGRGHIEHAAGGDEGRHGASTRVGASALVMGVESWGIEVGVGFHAAFAISVGIVACRCPL